MNSLNYYEYENTPSHDADANFDNNGFEKTPNYITDASRLGETGEVEETVENTGNMTSDEGWISPYDYYRNNNFNWTSKNDDENGMLQDQRDNDTNTGRYKNSYWWCDDLKNWCVYRVNNEVDTASDTYVNTFVLLVWNGISNWVPFKLDELVLRGKNKFEPAQTRIIERKKAKGETVNQIIGKSKFLTPTKTDSPKGPVTWNTGIILKNTEAYTINDEDKFQTMRWSTPQHITSEEWFSSYEVAAKFTGNHNLVEGNNSNAIRLTIRQELQKDKAMLPFIGGSNENGIGDRNYFWETFRFNPLTNYVLNPKVQKGQEGAGAISNINCLYYDTDAKEFKYDLVNLLDYKNKVKKITFKNALNGKDKDKVKTTLWNDERHTTKEKLKEEQDRILPIIVEVDADSYALLSPAAFEKIFVLTGVKVIEDEETGDVSYTTLDQPFFNGDKAGKDCKYTEDAHPLYLSYVDILFLFYNFNSLAEENNFKMYVSDVNAKDTDSSTTVKWLYDDWKTQNEGLILAVLGMLLDNVINENAIYSTVESDKNAFFSYIPYLAVDGESELRVVWQSYATADSPKIYGFDGMVLVDPRKCNYFANNTLYDNAQKYVNEGFTLFTDDSDELWIGQKSWSDYSTRGKNNYNYMTKTYVDNSSWHDRSGLIKRTIRGSDNKERDIYQACYKHQTGTTGRNNTPVYEYIECGIAWHCQMNTVVIVSLKNGSSTVSNYSYNQYKIGAFIGIYEGKYSEDIYNEWLNGGLVTLSRIWDSGDIYYDQYINDSQSVSFDTNDITVTGTKEVDYCYFGTYRKYLFSNGNKDLLLKSNKSDNLYGYSFDWASSGLNNIEYSGTNDPVWIPTKKVNEATLPDPDNAVTVSWPWVIGIGYNSSKRFHLWDAEIEIGSANLVLKIEDSEKWNDYCRSIFEVIKDQWCTKQNDKRLEYIIGGESGITPFKLIGCASNIEEIETASWRKSQGREGLTTGIPTIERLPSGELMLSTALAWGGCKHIMGNVYNDNNPDDGSIYGNKGEEFVNSMCRVIFGDGTDKTIDDDWLKVDSGAEEDSKSNSSSIHDNVLLEAGYIFEQKPFIFEQDAAINTSDTFCIEITTNRPIIDTGATAENEDVAKKW